MKKKIFGIFLAAICLATSAFAEGDKGHGGDPCEERIKQIRKEILNDWILPGLSSTSTGGAKELNFQYGVRLSDYLSEMKSVLEDGAVQIKCIQETPENHYMPVTVDGVPKTCKSTPEAGSGRHQRKATLVCDYNRFLNIKPLLFKSESTTFNDRILENDGDRIPLIHHEFDSLHSIIEKSLGADSDYFVSDQVAEYVGVQQVYKLGLKKLKSDYTMTASTPLRCAEGLLFEAMRKIRLFNKITPTLQLTSELAARDGTEYGQDGPDNLLAPSRHFNSGKIKFDLSVDTTDNKGKDLDLYATVKIQFFNHFDNSETLLSTECKSLDLFLMRINHWRSDDVLINQTAAKE